MSEVLQLDLQKISNKLKPLAEVQVSKESMIDDNYDINTKNFLTFIIETIETAKAAESSATDTVILKVNNLIKDANAQLSTYFENNSLSAYYDNVLSTALDSLSETAAQSGSTLDLTNAKTLIVDALKTINDTSETERNKQFELSLKKFQEEFSESFSSEIQDKNEELQEEVTSKVKKEIDKNKANIEKDVKTTTDKLLVKTIPEYVKSLDKVFNKNFKQYIENNFTNKNKQVKIANRLRNVFNSVLMPFAYASKYVKSAKDNLLVLGRRVKIKISEKILKPLTAWKERLKTGFTKKMHDLKLAFLKKTRIFRRPKKVFALWLGKVKKNLDSNKSLDTLRKYGILGLLAKGIFGLARRVGKKFRMLSSMDFKPFRLLNVKSNSIDEFNESITSHSVILLSNLKHHFDKTEVEGYDTRKKLGFFGKLKEKFTKKDKEGKGFNLLEFLMSLPGLFKMFKKIWNLLKKIYNFIKSSIKFIWKVSKALVKGIARFIGKSLAKIGTKLGWKAAANVGNKMAQWGAKGVTKNTAKSVGKQVGKGGIKGFIKNLRPSNLKNLKSVQKVKGIFKALKPSSIAAAVKGSKLLAKGGMKAAAKAAGKAAGKAIGKGLSKMIPNPVSTITAFAMDAAFAYAEAQDTDAMAALYGIKASEVGAQQRTAYVVAGTLVGGSSLLDADWSSPASIGMAALDTGMTMMKWAGVGAMIGSVIPGVGTLVGAAIGAGLGLVLSLIGTQRLAKAINWICDKAKAVWKWLKWTPLGWLGYGLYYAGKALWAIGKGIVKGIAWLGKGLWKLAKGTVKLVGWLGKAAWKGIKWLGKGIGKLGKMMWTGIKNLWKGALNLGKKLFGAVKNIGKKVGKFMLDLGKKALEKAKAFANSIRNGIMKIGGFLKDSIFSIGKSLLSTIFPFSPKNIGKAIGNVFKSIKNFFFGEDDAEKQLKELKEKLKNINSSASDSYSFALSRKLQEHVILDSTPNEGNDVDDEVKTDIFDMSKLTDMVDELLKVSPKAIPIPQEVKGKEKTPATVAAEHWDPMPATT